jgi:hypothetical protein
MGIQVKDKDFYSLHGIWGANASLALGRAGKGAGMVVGNVQPPARALFAGYGSGTAAPVLLPFAPNVKVGLGAESYVANAATSDGDAAAHPEVLPKLVVPEYFGLEDITREMSLGGESWKAGRLTMTVTSFFGDIPDPARTPHLALRKAMCPAIYIRLVYDNTGSAEPLTGVFGMQGIRRPLSDSTNGALLGFAHLDDWGFAVLPGAGIDEVMDWRAIPAAFDPKPRALRRLASEGVLRFRVGAGEKREFLIACGAYRDGIVTSGLRTKAFHSGLFRDLEEVLFEAHSIAADKFAAAARLDEKLDAAPISDDRKFLVAHAAHSYAASTELLIDEKGAPVFIVNEGEYQMMNTLDLTVDQAFHELVYSPWTVRNELDFFYAQSSYRDDIGLAFSHDQGVADCFTPKGTSSYELAKLTGCFSYMSYEETLNWILTACLYVKGANDAAWFARNRQALSDAVNSIIARDGNGDGVMDRDSARCEGGAEITTYDSLDTSLGQARNNLYVAVKAWSALVCSAAVFESVDGAASGGSSSDDDAFLVREARVVAAKIAHTVVSRVHEPEGYIPAVFEGGNDSKIIPAVEGLIYPTFCGAPEAVSLSGPYGELIAALKRHLEAVLVPGVCLDAKTGGWKLSSTSDNTWLSKIFINQYVAENILGIKDGRTARDAVHVHWQCNGSADWAATDQVESTSGRDLGSRLYPRLVSSILWM